MALLCCNGDSLYEDIRRIPLFDTHMHCSSLTSVGAPCRDGFATDFVPGCPADKTDLITLLTSPYLFGQHIATHHWNVPVGCDFTDQWAALVPCLQRERGTGLFLALNTALEDLHGISLRCALSEGVATAQKLSHRITESYATGLFDWSKAVMEKAGIVHAFKPVHTSYLNTLMKEELSPLTQKELSLYTPIYRTDDLFGVIEPSGKLSFPQLPCEITSLAGLENAMDDVFRSINHLNSPCIKQLQAYNRTLRFEYRTREEAAAAFSKAQAGDRQAALIVQDYIMERILSHGMKYQIHTGMTNIGYTSPAMLRSAIERHPEVPFVFLHCYPYVTEALAMLWIHSNVYLDLSWLQLLSPSILRNALREGLSIAPMNRIFLSTDSTCPEEQYGTACGIRRVLAQVLEEKMALDGWDRATALDAAHALLHKNAEDFYEIHL